MNLQRFFIIFQYLIPQILLSKFAGYLANCKIPVIKNFFINTFIKLYKIDLKDAIFTNPTQYKTFNDFFTRKLKSNARQISNHPNIIVSPVDGFIYQFGDIHETLLLQAKNHYFNLVDLLGGNHDLAKAFMNKRFISIYLAPQHYHRIHMPITGQLIKMIYVPGKLFSVNPITVENIPNLFARNERVICVFTTEKGKFCVILVGAMLVGSIYTSWHTKVIRAKKIHVWDYSHESILLNKGEELGYFAMGSTVIMLFEDHNFHWSNLISVGQELKLGDEITLP
jgi:phosphatidylserine decarboxylase